MAASPLKNSTKYYTLLCITELLYQPIPLPMCGTSQMVHCSYNGASLHMTLHVSPDYWRWHDMIRIRQEAELVQNILLDTEVDERILQNDMSTCA